MIRWPVRALSSVAKLFGQLQDLDVYVEDAGMQAFYKQLFTRVAANSVRIATVIPVGDRFSVEEHARNNPSPRSLYVVDGDLDWVAGLHRPTIDNLFRLEMYCIENALICESAAIEVAVDSAGTLERNEASAELDWSGWTAALREHLVELFLVFAAARVLAPQVRSVSHGHSSVCTQAGRGEPKLDPERVKVLRDSVYAAIAAEVGADDLELELERLRERIAPLGEPLDVVSGKDFLLPLLRFKLRGIVKDGLALKSLRFRLARHCRLDRFTALKDAMLTVAIGGTYRAS